MATNKSKSELKNPMGEIVDRLEEMRGFFQIGDGMIPFLTDLFMFLQEIMPLMTKMNISLEDTTHKLPSASDKINDVSDATEMATQEILDKLDTITDQVETLRTDNKKLIEEIHGNLLDINFALQFQDITTQKLEYATRILNAIYEKFLKLYHSLESIKGGSELSDKIFSSITAEMDEDLRVKEKSDFDEQTVEKIHDTAITQDDIDDLFG